jgi:hypothetical protein
MLSAGMACQMTSTSNRVDIPIRNDLRQRIVPSLMQKTPAQSCFRPEQLSAASAQ